MPKLVCLQQHLQQLREKIGALQGGVSRDVFSLPDSLEIPRGALIELTGDRTLEWLCGFFREYRALNVFWAEPEFTVLPTALAQRGVNLDRFLFAETGSLSSQSSSQERLFKALRLALRGQVFECLVAPHLFFANSLEEEKTLKALQLLAEKANATVFFIPSFDEPRGSAAWPIAMRLKISRASDDGISVTVLKDKTRGIA